MKIRTAKTEDAAKLEILINSAYRGKTSKKTWTNEANLLAGKRIHSDELQKIINEKNADILKCTDDKGEILACVYLKKNADRMYLGMLSVSPEMQAQGIGKELLLRSEEFAKQNKCIKIEITVFSVRSELIAWYERHGYNKTGASLPYIPNPHHGIPKQSLEFIVMEKLIS